MPITLAAPGSNWLNALGIEVRLLLAASICAYVKRNKTNATDARPCSVVRRCFNIYANAGNTVTNEKMPKPLLDFIGSPCRGVRRHRAA